MENNLDHLLTVAESIQNRMNSNLTELFKNQKVIDKNLSYNDIRETLVILEIAKLTCEIERLNSIINQKHYPL